MNETMANGYSSDSTQRELSNVCQHGSVKMIFIIFCFFVHLTKVALAGRVKIRVRQLVAAGPWSWWDIVRWESSAGWSSPGRSINLIKCKYYPWQEQEIALVWGYWYYWYIITNLVLNLCVPSFWCYHVLTRMRERDYGIIHKFSHMSHCMD